MLCQCCGGSGAVLGVEKAFPTQACWPCDATGVTPDGRLGPAEIVMDSVRMAKMARKMRLKAEALGLLGWESDIVQVNVPSDPERRRAVDVAADAPHGDESAHARSV